MMAKTKLISFKVIDFIEIGDILKVIVETVFGEHTVRMPKEAKYLHIETQQPQWTYIVKEYLEKKFKDAVIPSTTPDYKQYKGKTMKLGDIEDRSVEALHENVIEERKKVKEDKIRKKLLHDESFKENLAELRAERKIIGEERLKRKLEKLEK